MLPPEIKRIGQANMEGDGADEVWRRRNREGRMVARGMAEAANETPGPARYQSRQGRSHYDCQRGGALPIALSPSTVQGRSPNQLWAPDTTYASTWQGWLYGAFVIDVSARPHRGRAAGVTPCKWAFALDALEQALNARQPSNPMVWCITAIENPSTSPFAIRNALPKRGLSLPSAVRRQHDNALAESATGCTRPS